MATKNCSSSLVSGLGMAMRFLQDLLNEIVDQGGHPEYLQMLTAECPQAKAVVRAIADLIIKSQWKMPRSLAERLAVEKSIRNEIDNRYVEWDKKFGWDTVELGKFGIPMEGFGKSSVNSNFLPIPQEIIDQLKEKPVTYPLLVTYQSEEYIIVGISDDSLKIGEIPDVSDLEFITIAPSKYFDLDR